MTHAVELNEQELVEVNGGINPILIGAAIRAAWRVPAVRTWTIRTLKGAAVAVGAKIGWDLAKKS